MRNPARIEIVKYKVPYVYFPAVPDVNDGIVVPLDSNFHAVTDRKTTVEFYIIPKWYVDLWLEYAIGNESAIKSLYSKVENPDEIDHKSPAANP